MSKKLAREGITVTPWRYTVECSNCGTTHTEPDDSWKGQPCGSTTYCKGRYVLVAKSRRIVK